MIADLARYIESESPVWRRLEKALSKVAADPYTALTIESARELDYLYRRTSADLTRLQTFSGDPALCEQLERLVARAYAQLHSAREQSRRRWSFWRWLTQQLPQTFRRRGRAFALASLITLVGAAAGAFAVAVDPEAKAVILPFSHLLGDPRARVQREEAVTSDRLAGGKASFAGRLMTHNTQVTLLSLALGISYGVGTILILFENGVILGAIVLDYIRSGESAFLFGWLLPHGIVEIPAILVGSQAGLVLARALIGGAKGQRLPTRLRAVTGDIATLAAGAALMLVWAGLVESYLSQYHEPAIPYIAKILLGVAEGFVLVLYFALAGRKRTFAGSV